jgi:hypothetical protein
MLLGWPNHGEMGNAYKIVLGRPEGSWEYDIKANFK